jgi:hypothetical protein
MIIFYASTIARGGTIIESSGYLRTNKALEYRDVHLYVVLSLEVPGGIQLGMLIQLRLLKGRRNYRNPWVYVFIAKVSY